MSAERIKNQHAHLAERIKAEIERIEADIAETAIGLVVEQVARVGRRDRATLQHLRDLETSLAVERRILAAIDEAQHRALEQFAVEEARRAAAEKLRQEEQAEFVANLDHHIKKSGSAFAIAASMLLRDQQHQTSTKGDDK